MRLTSLLLAMVMVSAWAGTSGAADESAFGRCSIGTSERLEFVEDRLEQRRFHNVWWWRGWTAFYSIGVVVESIDAATEDDGGKRADNIVSAVKATGGVARLLLWPPNGRLGADPMREIAVNDESACRERLRVGEELLRENAKEAQARWDWKRHAANVAINVAGGLIVAEGFDAPKQGWRSAGIGIAVGEAFTFTHEWKADDDLADYEHRFGTGEVSARPVTFSISPRLGGLQLGLAF